VSHPDDLVTLPQLSELTGLTKHLLLKEVRENGMPVVQRPRSRGGDYLFNRTAILRWSFTRAKAVPAQVAEDDDLDLNAERARLTKEQADRAELDNDVMRRELVRRQPLEASLSAMDASLKDRLMMVPTAAAPEALTAGETAGSPGIAEVYRRHIGQALSDVAAAKLVSTIAN
jgi:phage terminase Nu1 subunit (DNA packaging protein)